MALQQGERYRCPDPNCGCEIEVTKDAQPGSGQEMHRISFQLRTAAWCDRRAPCWTHHN